MGQLGPETQVASAPPSGYSQAVPELQLLHAGHAPAVRDFELANRAYFAASVSDRGDEFFDEFTKWHSALLAEQETGIGAFYVLVAEDGSVLGRFNLYRFEDGTAELGYRVAQHVAGAAWRPPPCRKCADWRRRGTGCAHSGPLPPARMPRPRRSWPRPVLSRQAQPTRPTLAASPALGISAS